MYGNTRGKAARRQWAGSPSCVPPALSVIPFGLYADKRVLVAVTFGCAYAAVGFLDDLLKTHYKRNLGLRAYQKIAFQVVIAVIAGIYCYRSGLTRLNIPVQFSVLRHRGLDGAPRCICFCGGNELRQSDGRA